MWERKPTRSWCRDCKHLIKVGKLWECGKEGEEEDGVQKWVMCRIDHRRTDLAGDPPRHWEKI